MKYEVLNLLESELGGYIQKSKGNYAFHCPFCNHHKLKLEIQPDTQQFHCWTCDEKGNSLSYLLKKIGASSTKIAKMHELMNEMTYVKKDENKKIECKLPEEYIPLWKSNRKSFFWNTAVNYIFSRGVTLNDILKFRIGYCHEGKYKNMLIFPNYDEHGNLNYFTSRTFIRTVQKNKFINPPISRDVVGFELQVNWELPIILTESALDAIILKRNAIPLYGSLLPESLKKKIIEKDVKTIYICLDNDAIKKAINYTEYFVGRGINVHLIQLDDNRDPNDLGFGVMWEKINSSKPISQSELFMLKLQMNLK